MVVLSPSASPAEEEAAAATEAHVEEVHQEEVLQEDLLEEETTILLAEDLQDAEDPRTEAPPTTSRNPMSAANSPKPTSMFPTFLFPSMKRSLGNSSRITRSTN